MWHGWTCFDVCIIYKFLLLPPFHISYHRFNTKWSFTVSVKEKYGTSLTYSWKKQAGETNVHETFPWWKAKLESECLLWRSNLTCPFVGNFPKKSWLSVSVEDSLADTARTTPGIVTISTTAIPSLLARSCVDFYNSEDVHVYRFVVFSVRVEKPTQASLIGPHGSHAHSSNPSSSCIR